MAAPGAEAGATRVHAIATTVWAVGVLLHLIGNPAEWHGQAMPRPDAVVPIVLAGLAVTVALRPRSRAATVAATIGVMVLAAVRLPVLANNLVLLGLGGVALHTSRDPATALRNLVRAGAAAYAFAAFAKYNTAFLDPATSCAPVILDRLVGSLGLPGVPAWLAEASPVLTLMVESTVAIGLLTPRLRQHAATLGVLFHGLLAYDLDQHFWDFTSALLPIFVAAAPSVAGEVTTVIGRHVSPTVARVALLAVGVTAAASSVPGTALLLQFSGHLVWAVAGTAVVVGWTYVATVRRPRPLARGAAPRWSAAAIVLVTLVVVNGLTPYVQVKTGYSWNMYANLRVVGTTSNHLVVPPADLRGDHDDLLEVVTASDPGIAGYAERGEVLPAVQLTDWVARTPGSTVTARTQDGAMVTLDHDTVTRSRPAWLVHVAPLRAVTDACLLAYGPAG